MTEILTKKYIFSNMLRIYFVNIQDGQKKLGNLRDKDLAAYFITNVAFSAQKYCTDAFENSHSCDGTQD